jgi:hypothetical protein
MPEEMHRFAIRLVGILATGLIAWLFVANGLSPVIAESRDEPRPAPGLSPTEVVRIQLVALQRNDQPTPDAGIARAYQFASPGNRAKTGSLENFARMIHAGYAEMLNHRSAQYEQIVTLDSGEALQGVTLKAANGQTLRYVFILSRQPGPPCTNCWMTDGVLSAPQGKPI